MKLFGSTLRKNQTRLYDLKLQIARLRHYLFRSALILDEESKKKNYEERVSGYLK